MLNWLKEVGRLGVFLVKITQSQCDKYNHQYEPIPGEKGIVEEGGTIYRRSVCKYCGAILDEETE